MIFHGDLRKTSAPFGPFLLGESILRIRKSKVLYGRILGGSAVWASRATASPLVKGSFFVGNGNGYQDRFVLIPFFLKFKSID